MYHYSMIAPCADLVRSPAELRAYAQIRPCRRKHRYQRHDNHTADAYIDSLARIIDYLGVDNADLPWSPEDVQRFLVHRYENHGDGIPKVLAHLPAINAYHVANKFAPPRSVELTAFCGWLRKQHVRQPATPALLDDFVAMVKFAGSQVNELVAARDTALLLLGYAHAFRPIELSRMRWPHVTFRRIDLVVMLPRSKKNPLGREPEYLTVGAAWDPDLCPVRALRDWQALNPTQFVFPYIDRYGHMTRALSNSEIIKIDKYYGRAVGLQGKVTGYSIRRGAPTQLLENGGSKEEARELLRHEKQQTTDLYLGLKAPGRARSFTRSVLS